MNELLKKMSRAEIDDILFHALMAFYRFESEKIKRFGLGYVEILALQILRRRSPLRMRELVKDLGIPFSSATRLFARLEDSGYVKRIYAHEDRRGVYIHLAKEGEDVVKRIEDHSFEVISDNVKNFSTESLSYFIATVRNMDKLLAVKGGILPEENFEKKNCDVSI